MKHRARKFLSGLSISIAVFAFAGIFFISETGSSIIEDELKNVGMDTLSVMQSDGSGTTGNDTLAAISSVENVKSVSPLVMSSGTVYARNAGFKSYIWGVSEHNNSMIKIDTIIGREVSKLDISSCAKVCLITEQMAKEAWGRSNVVGKTIAAFFNGYKYEFKIVGIVKASSSILNAVVGADLSNVICVPYTTLNLLMGGTGSIGAGVRLYDQNKGDDTSQAIKNSINNKTLTVRNLAAQKDSIIKIIDVIRIVLYSVALVSVAVAAIGILAESWSSVVEDSVDIGIKRSLGASSADILLDVIKKSVMLSFAGTAAGILSAVAAVIAAATVFSLSAKITQMIAASAVMLACGVLLGAVCSLPPAIKAVKMQPIDSIRRD